MVKLKTKLKDARSDISGDGKVLSADVEQHAKAIDLDRPACQVLQRKIKIWNF